MVGKKAWGCCYTARIWSHDREAGLFPSKYTVMRYMHGWHSKKKMMKRNGVYVSSALSIGIRLRNRSWTGAAREGAVSHENRAHSSTGIGSIQRCSTTATTGAGTCLRAFFGNTNNLRCLYLLVAAPAKIMPGWIAVTISSVISEAAMARSVVGQRRSKAVKNSVWVMEPRLRMPLA